MNQTVPSPASAQDEIGTLEQPRKGSHNSLIIFLGILAFFGIGLGGVLLGKYLYGPKTPQVSMSVTPTPRAEEPAVTPSPDVTFDWETYTSFDYGYSIKYPAAIEVSSTIKKPRGEGFIFFSLPSQAYVTPKLFITHLQNSKRLSARNFYITTEEESKKERAEKGLPPPIPPKEMKDLEINGEKAFQIKAFAGDSDSVNTYFAKEEFIVVVTFSDYPIENDSNNVEHLRLFDQILSTFKFLD